MKIYNNFDVLTYLYQILNKDAVTSLLNGGKIFKDVRPTNSESNDLVMNTNFFKGQYESGANHGVCNINIYSKALKNGTPDYNFLETVFNQILSEFGKINYRYNGLYFSIDMVNVFPENEQQIWFYQNIRLKFQIN